MHADGASEGRPLLAGNRRLLEDRGVDTAPLRADVVRSAEILARIPAGRWGEPADLDGAVVFLCSAASDYVHGTVIAVDGGWLAR